MVLKTSKVACVVSAMAFGGSRPRREGCESLPCPKDASEPCLTESRELARIQRSAADQILNCKNLAATTTSWVSSTFVKRTLRPGASVRPWSCSAVNVFLAMLGRRISSELQICCLQVQNKLNPKLEVVEPCMVRKTFFACTHRVSQESSRA